MDPKPIASNGLLLEVRGVDVFHGDIQVVWDVSFQVQEGEVVALLGPNGAGKTTTLRAISGTLRARSGRIFFQGKEIAQTPPHRIARLGIAHVPEGRRVFPEMTVAENLEMGAYIPLRESRGRLKENQEKVFDLFPRLRERHRQLAGTLSGGEAQMLAIGRGLMSNPRLLILDELTLGLMPRLIESLFEAIRVVNAAGVTVLLVEQNLDEALSLAHRAYILEAGRIVLEGKGQDLLGQTQIRKAYLGL
ncbi:MAG TPA: ABC transporter ATP-binding protein [bacterium]|nr:ABC transporter ATP-binding protein [bacterium]